MSGPDGSVVLVTGGGSGIGFAAALMFARAGSRVAILGRNEERLCSACARLRETHAEVLPVAADVRISDSVARAVGVTIERLGPVATLVNCAGTAMRAALVHEITDSEWQEILDVNLAGTFRMIRATLPCMLDQGGGVIVNVASVNGLVGMRGSAAYGASKGGVIALTRSVAVEYGPFGIRCNCVCPGTAETPMTASVLSQPGRREACAAASVMNRIASADEIAHTIFFMGTPASSFLSGAVVAVDGGYTAR